MSTQGNATSRRSEETALQVVQANVKKETRVPGAAYCTRSGEVSPLLIVRAERWLGGGMEGVLLCFVHDNNDTTRVGAIGFVVLSRFIVEPVLRNCCGPCSAVCLSA